MRNASLVLALTALGASGLLSTGPALAQGYVPMMPQSATMSRGTGALRASADLKCGKDVYALSTGTSAGRCSQGTMPNPNGPGSIKTMTCIDSRGNAATANCASGCASSDGAGSCTAE
jgi:hypothetical protein